MDANLFFQDLEAKSELLEALSVQLGRINPWRGEKLKKYNDEKVYIIEHLNCNMCNLLNCVKLFNKSDIKINNKVALK